MAETVEFEDTHCIKDTDDAILVVVDDRQVWIPQSQVDDDSEVYEKGHSGTLVISEWIAIQKGLV